MVPTLTWLDYVKPTVFTFQYIQEEIAKRQNPRPTSLQFNISLPDGLTESNIEEHKQRYKSIQSNIPPPTREEIQQEEKDKQIKQIPYKDFWGFSWNKEGFGGKKSKKNKKGKKYTKRKN